MSFNLSAEEFYRLRDDRTNRVTDSRNYHELVVRIAAGSATVRSFVGQVQLLVACNLLARWCRRFELGFEDAELQSGLRMPGLATLHARIECEVREADPFARFEFRRARSTDVQYALGVGAGELVETADFRVHSSGWEVWAGQKIAIPDSRQDSCNPAGPAFAACLGMADAFKVATQRPAHSRVRSTALSLFSMSPLSAEQGVPEGDRGILELGRTQIVGLGSVGSAVIYLLRMIAISGRFQLIDHDTIGIENLNRSPLFGVSDLDEDKVAAAARHLKSVVPAEPVGVTYNEFIRDRGRKPNDVDLVLPLANEFNVRSVIEQNFPPLQIYGTTTLDWGANFHRHVPLRDDCSVCRFPTEATHAQLVCSTGKVEAPQGKQIDAALPFLSVSAASLAVADLLRTTYDGYPQVPNFAFIDLKGPLTLGESAEFSVKYTKRPRSGCLCAHRSRTIHQEYVARSRFAALA